MRGTPSGTRAEGSRRVKELAFTGTRKVDLHQVDVGVQALLLFLPVFHPAIARHLVGRREEFDDGDHPATAGDVDDLNEALHVLVTVA
jgi:hypothetical protein